MERTWEAVWAGSEGIAKRPRVRIIPWPGWISTCRRKTACTGAWSLTLPRREATILIFRTSSGGGNVLYQYYIASETHIFSPASLNEFRFAFNRTFPRTTTGPLDIQNHALDFLPGGGFGRINFTGTAIATGTAANVALTGIGNGATAPRDLLHNLFQVTDTFSYVRGAHSLKFGADVQRLQANYRWTPFPQQRGVYAFPSLLTFLQGRPSQLQFPEIGGDSSPIRGWRQTVFGWFVQDDFRVRANLTLNVGLRHEFVTAPKEVNGRNASLPSLTAAESVIGPPFPTSKDNFGPRLGLAWDPTGSGKTSVRAGFGLFYNLPIMGGFGTPLPSITALPLPIQSTILRIFPMRCSAVTPGARRLPGDCNRT